MDSLNQKTAILVLGMHRSGTSAMAGILSLNGYSVGKTLMDSLPENRKGFFENLSLWKFNNSLLSKVNCSWYSIFRLPNKFWNDQDKYELSNIIQNEFLGKNNIVIKDPLLCFLYPLYNEVLTQLGYSIKTVIVKRDLLRIALSLRKRNRFNLFFGVRLTKAYLKRMNENIQSTNKKVFIDFPKNFNLSHQKKVFDQIGIEISDTSFFDDKLINAEEITLKDKAKYFLGMLRYTFHLYS